MLIGLCGFARSGKFELAIGLAGRFSFTPFAFADAIRCEVKEIYDVPAPVVDRDSYQALLLKHGRERRSADPDYWITKLEEAVCCPPTPANIVVTDCRMPREIDWIRENDGLLVWVDRPGLSSSGDETDRDWSAACDVLFRYDGRPPSQLAATLVATLRSLGHSA